jgi:hypothetical protein
MKVRITAQVTYETDLDPSLYDYVDLPPVTVDEVWEWEKQALSTGDTPLLEALRDWGRFSNASIEKIDVMENAA